MLPCRAMELTIANISALVCIGLVAGLLGSMLGVGGGFIIVPVLILALKLPMQVAVGSSLVAIVANSCTAASAYLKTRMTNIRLGLLMETTTVPGAILGAIAATLLASSTLSIFFGIVLLYVSYSMIFRQPAMTEDIAPTTDSTNLDDDSSSFLGQSQSMYYDISQRRPINYEIKRVPWGLTTSFLAGILSSMLGIGGGIIKVPVMHSIMGIPIKVAIGTSSFMIALTTAAGALIYYHNGYVHPSIVTPLIVGVVGGALLGTSLAQRATGAWLRKGFGGLLLVTAILMFLRTANVM
ncbi:MAG: sulfite exporter TauE/SafE family protein [Chloroflexi bacterium]|nr:sulfite exporter TauE/SafE family protein [Chloroflexota bacterium]MBM3173273.1 sulfite exporter TauE/SafE family protein [Chloroflexota bacterium]MBM4449784.1 sulfite exporter TauE/SafE family protein [Chloroflexota bacterium]